MSQALSESLLIAGLGGFAGLLLAVWGLCGLVNIASGTIPTTGGFQLNAPGLAFAAFLMTAVTIAMGLAPLLHSNTAHTQEALRGRTAGVHGRRTRSILVVAEVSLTAARAMKVDPLIALRVE